MNEEIKTSDKEISTFDIANIPIASCLVSAHQEGNYLVGVTELGVKFRQHIPIDKMIDQNEKGEWVLVPLRVSLG